MFETLNVIATHRLPSRLALLAGLVLLVVAAFPLTAEEASFDTDRGVWLADADGDGYPDLTEELEGTDPVDPEDHPSRFLEELKDGEIEGVGFPSSSCRSGYRQAGSRLCISRDEQNARKYSNAAVFCRARKGRVCAYEDLRYLYLTTSLDASYNPRGSYLGDWTSDDKVLCGNKDITFNNDPDIHNFEGTCGRFAARNFWCCHDDDQ